MKAHFKVFVNYEKNNWARLLPMAEFAYNNAKHTSIGYRTFEFNYGYHPRVFYEENIKPRFRLKVVDELIEKLRNLIVAYRENLQHAQELQK